MIAGLLAAITVAVLGAAVRPRPGRPAHAVAADDAASPAPARASSSHAWPRSRSGRIPDGAHGPEAAARWCDELARAARAGSTLSAAVRTVPAPNQAVRSLQHSLERGAPLIAALAQAPAGDAAFQVAFTVLAACAEHGGPPAEPIDRAAATLRARAADIAERRTHSAQARLSALVMTWLPVAMLALLTATSASVRGVLTTPLGVGVVAAGGLLNLAGWRWMARIIEGRR